MSPMTRRGGDIDAVRKVLIRHRGRVAVGTFGDECLCGWLGTAWEDHVAPLLVDMLSPEDDSVSYEDVRIRGFGDDDGPRIAAT